MTQPKEIWINDQDAECIHHYGICQDAVIWADEDDSMYLKYLSEEHFNSLIEEKDKEILRLKAFISDLNALEISTVPLMLIVDSSKRVAKVFEDINLLKSYHKIK